MVFNKLAKTLREGVRLFVISIRFIVLRKWYGMNIHKSSRISFGAKLDKTNPSGIYIGKESYVASGAIVFSHDFSRALHQNTYIGDRCFIGANAIIMCGVTIGDMVIVGSGSIVTKNIPSNCIVAGNPAKIIREGVITGKYGRMVQIDKS